MESNAISYEEFINQAKAFIEVSDRVHDDWKLQHVANKSNSCYISKECFISGLNKAEYIISYNMSYNVPMFAFNIWDCKGALLTLEDIKQLSQFELKSKEIYSAVTQKEHPLFFRPFFVVHPCHTDSLLSTVKGSSKNLLVTFISLVAPLCSLKLVLEYGL